MIDWQECLEIAREAHKGQFRRIHKEPYINHPIRVAANFDDDKMKCIALLHDVIEDTGITDEELRLKGVDRDTIKIVKILSRREGETYYDFIMRIGNHDKAILIKIADIKDNIRDLSEGSLKDKYRLAQYVLGYKYSKVK